MAISKVKLPDNTVQDIKDSRITGIDTTPTAGSTNVITSGGVHDSLRVDKIAPITSHTYENVVATSSNVNTLFPLFRLIPTNWDSEVVVYYRVHIYVEGHTDLYYAINECQYAFFHDAVSAYSCKNFIGNASYRCIYYNSLMRCLAGYTSIGHLIGFNYYNSGNSYSRSCATSGYGRTFEVEITYLKNATVEWLNTCDTVASSISEYVAGTTHSAIANYNATTQGETHSGDANTNTVGYLVREPSAVRPTIDAFYRYRLLFSSPDNTKWIPANTSTSTNATAQRDVTQRPINPFGQIVWYNSTGSFAADASVTATNVWKMYDGVTLGYSFNRTNAALVLTYPAPVYLKCAPQADGSAIIDSTTPYVQALPSSSDGKIYIYLGHAYNATQITLSLEHPVYYHDGTGIKPWTGYVPSKDVFIAYYGYTTGSETTYNNMKQKSMVQDTTHHAAFDVSKVADAVAAEKAVFATEVDSSTGDIVHLYNLVYFNGTAIVFGEASRYIYIEMSNSTTIRYQNLTWTDFNGTYDSLPDKPTIPTVPTISTDIASDKTSDTKTASPKAVYDHVHPAIQTTQPSGGFLPNVMYNLGTLTGTVSFSLATPISGIVNHYYWTFSTGSTAPTITWPSGITGWNNGVTPPIYANSYYEISVFNGIGCYIVV